MHLREGVTFHDGSPFTSKDVVGTFYAGYLMNTAVWRYLEEVVAVDDFTVDFKMSQPSSVVPRYVLFTNIRSSSSYGSFFEDIEALVRDGKDRDSSEMRMLNVQFQQHRPTQLLGTGPYMMAPSDVTEAAAVLRRYDGYWNPESSKFDVIRVYNGETPAVTPLIMATEADYATHGFPPATEMQFREQGIRIVRPPIYTGPSLMFNHDVYPLNVTEVRHALAYAINKAENAEVSLGGSAIKQRWMTGVSDNLLPTYTTEEQRAGFEQFDYNPEKATEILEGIGFSKNSAGQWLDDQGNRLSFELIVPQEFADWSAAAQNVANQLINFGVDVTVRGVTHTQVPQEVWSGRFEMAIQGWGAANPHPHFSFYQNYITMNYTNGQAPGMNFNLVVDGVDLEELVALSAIGFDLDTQAEYIYTLAKTYNELLPSIPLWERYGNNPAVDGVRATNWPADDHPYWGNSPYADNPVTMFIYQGLLEPVE